jgi:hypothetical protein
MAPGQGHQGRCSDIKEFLVVAAVNKKNRNTRTIVVTLCNSKLISDIGGSLSITATGQYIQLWNLMQSTEFSPNQEDRFIWKWTSNQRYSALLAYRAFFLSQCSIPGVKPLPPPTPGCKFFIWLVLLGCTDCSSMDCKIVTLAHSAHRAQKQSTICCSLVSSVRRCELGHPRSISQTHALILSCEGILLSLLSSRHHFFVLTGLPHKKLL